MNRLKFIVLVAFLAVSTSSFAQFGKLLDKAKAVASGNTTSLNPSDIATALKQALEQGTSKSADLLSKENGFFGNDAVKI
ncbi:MAG: DUF4197 family protein, partial [Oligoflexus sp.]|nr:DUF4197 family protein [Pseudopedobacter sp.]